MCIGICTTHTRITSVSKPIAGISVLYCWIFDYGPNSGAGRPRNAHSYLGDTCNLHERVSVSKTEVLPQCT
jgi:hypothetical protein